MMNDLLEQRQEQSEKDTRRAWKFIGGCVVLLLFISVYLVFKDDPLQDDSWMLPVFTSTPESQNPLRDYIKAVEKLPVAEETLLPENVRSRYIGSEDGMRQFLSKHQALMDAWEQLIVTDSSSWRWPIDSDQMLPAEAKYLYASNKPGYTLSRMKVTLLTRDGQGKKAVEHALKMIKFGTGMYMAEGDNDHLITAGAPVGMALGALEEALTTFPASEEDLHVWQTELQQREPQFFQATFDAVKCEYARLKNVLSDPSSRKGLSDSASGGERVALKHFLRPNRTLNTYLLSGKQFLELEDVPGSESLRIASEQNQASARLIEQRWKLLLNPNAGGVIALDRLTYDREMLLNYTYRISTNYHMAIAMLAIRRYEMKYGKLPETLADIQPEFVAEIPLDPFNHQPLRWNAASKRLYAVGPDGVDNYAEFRKQRDIWVADYGCFYWWGDEASAYRRSLMQDKKSAPLNK